MGLLGKIAQQLLSASLREKHAVLMSTDSEGQARAIFVLVPQQMLLTAVPGGLGTNYKLIWAVKCVSLTSCFFLRRK